MNLLLDTHVLLWWLQGEGVAEQARTIISDPANLVAVSAASIWEISIKAALGKLHTDADIGVEALQSGFEPLPISFEHAMAAGSLPDHHRDPFDRMLIAQANLEGLVLATRDPVFGMYEVAVLSA